MAIEEIVSYEHIGANWWSIDAALANSGCRAGFDLGKRRHPSHLAIVLPISGINYQVASVWFDGESYTRQLDTLARLFDEHSVEWCRWDDTRGELEALHEQGRLPAPMLGGGFTFSQTSKGRIAGRLNLAFEREQLVLLPDDRQSASIVAVTNMLDAAENEEGHGDAFWSLALALEAVEEAVMPPHIYRFAG